MSNQDAGNCNNTSVNIKECVCNTCHSKYYLIKIPLCVILNGIPDKPDFFDLNKLK